MRNSQALASLSTGRPAEDRFSVPNPSKIRKAELTELNTKTLTPWKQYEPLKYLLENNYFHENARECILSILSVLEVRKVQSNASAKYEKSSKTLQNQKFLFDIFQTENSENTSKKVVGECNNLKIATVLHHNSEERNGDKNTCSDSQGSENDCKGKEGNLFISPFVRLNNMGSWQLVHTICYIGCYATPVQLRPCQILLLYSLIFL